VDAPKPKRTGRYEKVFAYVKGKLQPDRQAFVRDWLVRSAESSRGGLVYVIFHFVSLVVDPIIMDRASSYESLRYFHVAGIISYFAIRFRFEKSINTSVWIGTFLQVLNLSGYTYLLRSYAIEENGIGLLTLKAWTGVVVVGIIQVILWPGHVIRNRLLMAVASAIVIILSLQGTPFVRGMLPLGIFALFFAALGNIDATARTINEALREYEFAQLRRAHENARYTFEMDMARSIQHSMALPKEARIGDFQIYCYQSMHDEVGGDWAGAREDREGNLYVAVADAAGKGLQAALVVHSVQCLWAEHLNAPEFDPVAWIESLNRTLYELGRDEIHMVTVGITKISRERIDYWGAGHLPLYVAVDSADEQTQSKLVTLASTANPVGILPTIEVGCTSYEPQPGETFEIINHTDGVIVEGKRRSKRAIMKLYADLRTRGEDILDTLPASDDRTIMWIRQDVA